MDDAWDTLMGAGLPDGPPRPPPREPIPAAPVRAALELLEAGEPLAARLGEPLLAWLAALRHHWPSRFDEIAGPAGTRLAASLSARPYDENRYLKLRRIAIENLAGRL